MKIRPRSIPKFQGGNNIWYLGLIDYDPTKYLIAYDTSRLVNGDMSDTILSPWKSNISGYDVGRYLPTDHGAFGEGKEHYNYTLGVEGLDYYKKFGEDLLDSNGNFTPTGEAWARAVDALLPEGSNASFYDPKTKQLRTKWTTQYRDAHGRSAQTFTNLKDYVNHVRNDLLLGARHNVFLNKGKRYFYIDNLGLKHWVDPSVVDKYNVSKDPSEQGWEGTTYWDDYELTGLKNLLETPEKPVDPEKPEGGRLFSRETPDKESPWDNIWGQFRKATPDILDALRLQLNLNNNNRVFDTMIKGVKPALQLTYNTYRQVVGDEATKQAYYRRAAEGLTKAGRAFTSDADRQMAYLMEAKRIGDDLRAQGDLADNLEIRRTSDESNQHLWGNTQRATEVANHNILELINANATKRLLEALKYSADTSNWDNYLMGIQNRFELLKLRQQAIEDRVETLNLQDLLETDRGIKTANENLQRIIKEKQDAGVTDIYNDPQVLDASRAVHKAQRDFYKRYYSTKRFSFKRGAKIEYNRDDKYLYKTARDVVEHFRKMSKIADDSRIRGRSKEVKLSSHPKKYQYGGVAPFTIYRPLPLSNASSAAVSSDSGSSSSKSSGVDSDKSKLDLVKDLFKEIKGLPIDTSMIYQEVDNLFKRNKLFGLEMTSDDIASIYLKAMQRLSHLQYSQNEYNKALTLATNNDALGEFAVGANGEIVIQNMDTGEIKKSTLSLFNKLEGNWNPLTNKLLLTARAHSPNLAFDDKIFDVVSNGVGMTKISEQIQKLAGHLSAQELKIEGISEVLSGKIKAGLLTIAGFSGSPDGYYKIAQESKDPSSNISAALKYIYSSLPNNYKTILKLHAGGDEGALNLILSFLNSQTGSRYEESISPLTGKASDKDGKDSLDKISSNPQLAMIREIGGSPINYSIVTRDSNTKMSVNGTAYPALPNVKEDMSIDNMLSVSGFDSVVLSKAGITFGDLQIDPNNLRDIMYANSGRNAIVTLPCKIVNGVKQVNLAIRDEYEKAELKAANLATRGTNEYLRILGQELKNAHLDSLLDSNGLPDKNMFSEFLIVEAYTTDKIDLNNKNSLYIEKVRNPSEDLENRINLALSTDNKKSNYKIDVKDKLSLFELTYNDVYRGTVFIPINNNPAAAMLNNNIKINQQQDLEELYLISNKSNKYIKDNSF